MINEYNYENTKAYQNLGTALVCALQLLDFLQSYLFFIREIAKLYIIAHPNFGLTWLVTIDDVTLKLICIFSLKRQMRSNKQLSRILLTIIKP